MSNFIETSLFDGVLTPPYGTTLDQISNVLNCLLPFNFQVSALSIGIDETRSTFVSRVRKTCGDRCYGLVNFLRSALDQPGEGHWSPVVLSSTGMHVVSDVAKYKESAEFSLTDEALYDAVNNVDACGVWEYGSQGMIEDAEDDGWKDTIKCEERKRGLIILNF